MNNLLPAEADSDGVVGQTVGQKVYQTVRNRPENPPVNQERVNLTPREAAERLRVHPGVLATWRSKGTVGLRYIRFGRKVLYPLAEIIAFEQKNLRTSTAENGCRERF
jgi:hypothetical protein